MNAREVTIQQHLRAPYPLDKKYGPYANITARNAIPVEERYITMKVGVLSTNAEYQLRSGIENSNWMELGINDGNIDGGTADTIYETDLLIDGGGA